MYLWKTKKWKSEWQKEKTVIFYQSEAQKKLSLYAVQYRSPPLSMGDTFQDLRWMPEISDDTKLYMFFPYNHNYDEV